MSIDSYEIEPVDAAIRGKGAVYGDLIYNREVGGYRNHGVYIYNGTNVVNLSDHITAYGTLPPMFVVGTPHPIYKTPIPFLYWRGELNPDYKDEEKDEDLSVRISAHSEMYWNAYEFHQELLANLNRESNTTWCYAYGSKLTIRIWPHDVDEFIDTIQKDQVLEYEIDGDESTENDVVVRFLGVLDQ